MPRVSWLAQVAYYMVGMEVYTHADEEYDSSYDELRTCEPVCSVHSGRSLRVKPSTDEICIQSVEDQTHEHDCDRHLALSS